MTSAAKLKPLLRTGESRAYPALPPRASEPLDDLYDSPKGSCHDERGENA
jgi:hypothetical protein